jgi:Cdc25 family phosphatase
MNKIINLDSNDFIKSIEISANKVLNNDIIDNYIWARDNNLYIKQDEVVQLLKQNDDKEILIIDTRDDDFIGGNIINSKHYSDKEMKEVPNNLVLITIEALKLNKNSIIIFHCMESLRRGPRCCYRLNKIFEMLNIDNIKPDLRILIGGADQWIRKYWNSDLVENYNDEYWGFSDDQLINNNQHKLYLSPNDGLKTI